MRAWLLAVPLSFAALLPAPAQAPVPSGPAGPVAGQQAPKANPGTALVAKGLYAEALPPLEAGLKADPQSRDLLYAKVEALSGLGRNIEARSLAMQTLFSHKDWQEFRFQAGECSWNLGQAQQAVQAWTPLFSDPDWGDLAITSASRALRASGREDEAKQLVLGAVARQEKPAPVLLREGLDLDGTGPGCLKIIDKLIAADPQSKNDYENLRKLYASIGDGKISGESLSGSLPAAIKLKELSIRREVGTLLNPGLLDNDILAKTDDVRTTRESLAPPKVGPPTSTVIQTGRSLTAPVSIDGGPVEWMLLDSSGDTFMVTPKVAKANGLYSVSTRLPLDSGEDNGGNPSKLVMLRELRMGPLAFKNVPAQVVDRHTDVWKTVAGVFPLSALRRYGILYDPRNGRLVLYQPGTKADEVIGEGHVEVPCLWVLGKPLIPLSIHQTPNLMGLVAVNSERTLITGYGATASSMGPISKRRPQSIDMRIGFVVFHLTSAEVAPTEDGFTPAYSAVMGRDIWDLFTLYFDPSRGTLSFQAARK